MFLRLLPFQKMVQRLPLASDKPVQRVVGRLTHLIDQMAFYALGDLMPNVVVGRPGEKPLVSRASDEARRPRGLSSDSLLCRNRHLALSTLDRVFGKPLRQSLGDSRRIHQWQSVFGTR